MVHVKFHLYEAHLDTHAIFSPHLLRNLYISYW